MMDQSDGGLMHDSQSIPICMGIQVQPCQSALDQFLVVHGSRKWYLIAQLKVTEICPS